MKTSLMVLTLFSSLAYGAQGPIPENENITPLLEGHREVTSLSDIEKMGLISGTTGLNLWSGSYWPHYQGGLGVRYRDASFITLMKNESSYENFKDLKDKKPLYSYQDQETLLSPAEKYDLLVGDSSMTLTKYSWELGEKAMKLGGVPTWRGICDGWSSASQMMPRPVKTVTLKSPRGMDLTFYPEDLKALGSLLYARAQENVIFLGKRCYSRALGLFTDACEGTNPGAFHKALINRVGKIKKSFIADVSPGAQVWNYPVQSYEFTYYNVFTETETKNFKNAYEVFTKKNRFEHSKRRHKNTYAIVGVKAEVVYANMREVNLSETDGPELDQVLKKTYWYDLELDRNFNILGGEWVSADVPDFIWAPNDRTYPLSDAEQNGPPQGIKETAAFAKISSKAGQPLSVIVEKLFKLSSGDQ